MPNTKWMRDGGVPQGNTTRYRSHERQRLKLVFPCYIAQTQSHSWWGLPAQVQITALFIPADCWSTSTGCVLGYKNGTNILLV